MLDWGSVVFKAFYLIINEVHGNTIDYPQIYTFRIGSFLA